MENYFLFDESAQVAMGIKPHLSLRASVALGKFAFAFDSEKFQSDNTCQELIGKIIQSVNQSLDNSLLVNLSDSQYSLHGLSEKGIEALIVFSDIIPDLFDNIAVKHNTPFQVEGVYVLITRSIENFSADASSKNLLWSFMKKILAPK